MQSALSLDIMCNTVYSDVMQTIRAADPTLPQQPISMQSGIAVLDLGEAPHQEGEEEKDVEPLSARCKHPVSDAWDVGESTSKVPAVVYCE